MNKKMHLADLLIRFKSMRKHMAHELIYNDAQLHERSRLSSTQVDKRARHYSDIRICSPKVNDRESIKFYPN